jgi:hypothetical protein
MASLSLVLFVALNLFAVAESVTGTLVSIRLIKISFHTFLNSTLNYSCQLFTRHIAYHNN